MGRCHGNGLFDLVVQSFGHVFRLHHISVISRGQASSITQTGT